MSHSTISIEKIKFLFIASLLVLCFCFLAIYQSIANSSIFIISLILFALVILKEEVGLILIIITSTVFDYSMLSSFLVIFGANIRLHQMLIVVTFLGWLLRLILKRTRYVFGVFDIFSTVYLLTLLISIPRSISMSRGIKIFFLYFFQVLTIWLTIQIVCYSRNCRKFIWILISIGIFESVLGIYQFAGNPFGIFWKAGWETSSVEFGVRASGTFVESVWFGVYTMTIFSLLLVYYFSRSNLKTLVGLVTVGCANLLSFTRASWLGIIAGGLSMLVYSRRFKYIKVLTIILLFFALITGTLSYINPKIVQAVHGRFSSIFAISNVRNVSDIYSVDPRVALSIIQINQTKGYDWIFGHGPGQFKVDLWRSRKYFGFDINIQGAGGFRGSGGNQFVDIFYEAGFLGLIAWFMCIFYFNREVLHALKICDNEKLKLDIYAFYIVSISLFISFFFLHGLFMGVWSIIFGITLGLARKTVYEHNNGGLINENSFVRKVARQI